MGRSLLEGNQDHLPSKAKSELMRQEHQVGFSQMIVSVSTATCLCSEIGMTRRTTRYIESRREQVRLQEELSMKEKALRDTQIRSMHEMGE